MKSLTARLVLYYSLVVTATVALATVLGFALVKRQLLVGSDFLLDKEYEEIHAKLQPIAPLRTAEALHAAVYSHAVIDSPMFFFQIHDETGQVLFRSPNLRDHYLPDLSDGPEERKVSLSLSDLGMLRIAEFYQGDLHVQLATSLGYLDNLSTQFRTSMGIALPVVLLLSVAVGFGLSQVTLRPLRLIQQTANRISATSLNERIPLPKGNDELSHLARLLNQMFDRLERSFIQIKQIAADTSHELRTPLSIIGLRTEKALEHPDLPAAVREELQDVLAEVQRLNGVIDQLLILAKAEARALPLNKQLRSTSQFIEQFEEDARTLAEQHGRRFEVTRNEEAPVSYDAGWLRQVLFNLLSNAIKFSSAGSLIRIESLPRNGQWQVTFSNEGSKVPPDQLNSIFDRFTQVRSPGINTSGLGLGLAVSKSIIQLHQGRISGRNLDQDQGFAVIFEIPLVAPS